MKKNGEWSAKESRNILRTLAMWTRKNGDIILNDPKSFLRKSKKMYTQMTQETQNSRLIRETSRHFGEALGPNWKPREGN